MGKNARRVYLTHTMAASKIPEWLLILGISYVFLFFGIDKFLHPILWIGWIPLWMESFLSFSRAEWLSFFGGIEILLAVLLLVPKRRIRLIASTFIALHMIGVLSQAGLFNEVGVRDTGILCAVLALAWKQIKA